MKFDVNSKALEANLRNAVRFIPSSNATSIPALTGIMLEAREDRLILTGSDGATSIQITIKPDAENDLHIEETGTVVIESRYFAEMMKHLDDMTVSAETSGNAVILKTENGTYSLNAFTDDAYPEIDFGMTGIVVDLATEELMEIIFQTVYCTTDRDPRVVLGGVNFRSDGNTLTCAATDSYRLAVKKKDISAQPFDITIPAEMLKELAKMKIEQESVRICIARKQVRFELDNTIIQSKLLEGMFPDINRIVPRTGKCFLTIDTEPLIKAVSRIGFLKDDRQLVIKLAMDNEAVTIKAEAAEIGQSVENLRGHTWAGDRLEMAINGGYLLSALKALKAEQAEFQFTGTLSPVLVQGKGQGDAFAVLVPIRSHY